MQNGSIEVINRRDEINTVVKLKIISDATVKTDWLFSVYHRRSVTYIPCGDSFSKVISLPVGVH